METTGDFYWPMMVISNIAAMAALYYSWKKPLIARIGICALLFVAGIANWLITIDTFQTASNSNFTFSVIDGGLAHHWFAMHSDTAIRLIASCQWLVAVSLLMRFNIRKIGAIAGIILLLIVAPIGFGSPFPFTFIIALALYAISRESQADTYNANEAVHELNGPDND